MGQIKGGYSMVDATGLDLGNPVKVDGIYNKLLTAYKADKLVVIENAKNGTAKFTPIAAFLAMESTTIILTIMNLPYRVSSDDTIVQA